MENVSYFIILGFILIVLIYSLFKKNNAYNSFLEGCKDSMKIGVTILPYLLVMYVAVNVFKASHFLDDLIKLNRLPNEIIMQGAFRPISSHASLSMMLSTISKYGVDSKEGIVSAILQGGSDTTVYVFGLYFGIAGIKKTRHAYFVGLLCDLIATLLCIYIFFILI